MEKKAPEIKNQIKKNIKLAIWWGETSAVLINETGGSHYS